MNVHTSSGSERLLKARTQTRRSKALSAKAVAELLPRPTVCKVLTEVSGNGQGHCTVCVLHGLRTVWHSERCEGAVADTPRNSFC